ncbi:hypothetical protein [Dongia sp.]|uniref:hypothetical protein n=1 Tax=Dongia sp. TaxID=1977262 RepID=UPI0037533672
MRASFPVLRCCGDILIGLLVLATAWGLGFGLLRILPEFLSAFLNYTGTLGILIALGIVVPPATLVILGKTRKRIGLTLSPVFAATLAAVGFLAAGYLQMLEVRELEQRAFLKPEAQHDVLVLPSSGCDIDCMKVLTQTSYSVAGYAASSTDQMVLYRKASGDVCYQKDNVAMLIKFTRAGYAGVCTTQSPITDLSDALILERQVGRGNHPELNLPSWYDGAFYSFIERNNGKDRLLGRWADGKVKALTEFPVGPRFEELDFYGAALGVHFPKEKVFGKDDLVARVEKLRPILKSPDVQPEVVWAYGDLLNELRNSRPAVQEPIAAPVAAPGEPSAAPAPELQPIKASATVTN